MKKHQSRSSEVCAEWREHPGGCDCYQLSLNVFHRAFRAATKNHIKGGRGSFETPPLWENRRQKTATQINYKLSRVERDVAYMGSALCETHKACFVKTATMCAENKNNATRTRWSSVLWYKSSAQSAFVNVAWSHGGEESLAKTEHPGIDWQRDDCSARDGLQEPAGLLPPAALYPHSAGITIYSYYKKINIHCVRGTTWSCAMYFGVHENILRLETKQQVSH